MKNPYSINRTDKKENCFGSNWGMGPADFAFPELQLTSVEHRTLKDIVCKPHCVFTGALNFI